MTVTEKDKVLDAVAEPKQKKSPAKKVEQTETAEPKAKKAPAKKPVEQVVEAPAVEAPAQPKKQTKKAEKANQPLYINGRYVVEKQLKAKPKKGSKPYELSKNKIKVTLVKSTNGCLQNQIKTVKALGLTKIHQSVVHCDNAAIRGMIFKVKHLVTVENA